MRLLSAPSPFLDDPDPAVRRLAVSVCVADGLDDRLIREMCRLAVDDPDGAVRAASVEALSSVPSGSCDETLTAARSDDDPRVLEALCVTYGELGDRAAMSWLVEMATSAEDRAVREAAVAALGALEDPAALPTLLSLAERAPARVRRRAIVALTVFDDPEVEPTIRRAATDRNPAVREIAEMIVGRTPS